MKHNGALASLCECPADTGLGGCSPHRPITIGLGTTTGALLLTMGALLPTMGAVLPQCPSEPLLAQHVLRKYV